ncbi:RecQ-mediated genome instability protein 1 [Wickerhamomyces ciferrii]|uniref:RecQ-mediated genome instability protein 1 n=1 Tax=Wickerhamomyces ciferrii (strain ATCC 14091 / BCRC 22168 / CBS 111 / JCM 3599 / NBRC 0793 / NRRL Y-1031 F-60-10) TaxID=1206466 RepID=K0KIS9_WICCF|nr:RecQ-mediated genome instability protein 1 [Wickerhamomyces ciferrii]CCH41058.1 RecQ-mediated genome instability protein 1 [Wickerhamomyces ciferrii]
MTQLTRYLIADLANTSPNRLDFPSDERSQRALKASKFTIDTDSNKVSNEILLQIVSLDNMSQSRLTRLDDLLAADDMDAVGADRLRGRQQRIVRNVNLEDDDQGGNNQQQQSTSGNHNSYYKLTLQDCFGNLIYGIEVEKLSFLTGNNQKSGFPIQLGSKILIHNNTEIISGVLLLSPSKIDYLGGMVPSWNLGLDKKHIQLLKDELEEIKAQG